MNVAPGLVAFAVAALEPEYRRLWLGQNRAGGLDLSIVTVFGRLLRGGGYLREKGVLEGRELGRG